LGFDEVEVLADGCRQVFELSGAAEVVVPAFEFHQFRFYPRQVGGVGWEGRDGFAVEAVTGGYLERADAAEDVDAGDREAADAVEAAGMAERDQIEPAAAATAAGDGSVLLPLVSNLLSDGVIEFGDKRSAADPRSVGLADAEHVLDGAGADSGSEASATGDRVGRRDVGVSSAVKVEEGSLRAFEEDTLIPRHGVLDEDLGVADERSQTIGVLAVLLVQAVEGDRRGAEHFEQSILVGENFLEPLLEAGWIDKLAHPDAESGNFVLVSRSNSAACSTDTVLTARVFF